MQIVVEESSSNLSVSSLPGVLPVLLWGWKYDLLTPLCQNPIQLLPHLPGPCSGRWENHSPPPSVWGSQAAGGTTWLTQTQLFDLLMRFLEGHCFGIVDFEIRGNLLLPPIDILVCTVLLCFASAWNKAFHSGSKATGVVLVCVQAQRALVNNAQGVSSVNVKTAQLAPCPALARW